MSEPMLHCEALCRVYADGDRRVTVLQDVELSLAAGEKIAVVGASGSGKSTLLNLLGALDHPTRSEEHTSELQSDRKSVV